MEVVEHVLALWADDCMLLYLLKVILYWVNYCFFYDRLEIVIVFGCEFIQGTLMKDKCFHYVSLGRGTTRRVGGLQLKMPCTIPVKFYLIHSLWKIKSKVKWSLGQVGSPVEPLYEGPVGSGASLQGTSWKWSLSTRDRLEVYKGQVGSLQGTGWKSTRDRLEVYKGQVGSLQGTGWKSARDRLEVYKGKVGSGAFLQGTGCLLHARDRLPVGEPRSLQGVTLVRFQCNPSTFTDDGELKHTTSYVLLMNLWTNELMWLNLWLIDNAGLTQWFVAGPWGRQIAVCTVTRPFARIKGVACETTVTIISSHCAANEAHFKITW